MNSGFFEKIQTKNIIWAVIVFFYVSFLGALGFFAYSNAATVYTVCDSGCDFTTIDAAITGSTDEDTIRVVDGYTGVGEAATLTLNTSSTLECVGTPTVGNAGATTTIQYASGVTIQNCTFARSAIEPSGSGFISVVISGNTFDETYPMVITANGADDVTIQNNQNIGSVQSNNSSIAISIFDNTFSGVGSSKILLNSAGLSSAHILNNQFFTETDLTNNPIFIAAGTVVFATNTVVVEGTQTTGAQAVLVYPNQSAYIGGNFIKTGENIAALGVNAQSNSVPIDIKFNTIKHYANTTILNSNFGISISDNSYTNIPVNVSYNLVTNYDAPEAEIAIGINGTGGGNILFTGDYNATFGTYYNANDELRCSGSVTGCTMGSHWRSQKNPHLRIWNLSTNDDLYPAPWSDLLDVDGDLDIGAYSAARRTTAYINGAASIDYSAVDATSTDLILTASSTLRAGDTIQFASGDYQIQSFSTSTVSGNLTIDGAGVGATILRPAAAGIVVTGLDGLTLTDVTVLGALNAHTLTFDQTSNSTVSNVVFQNASSTATSYLISNAIYSYGGTDYDDADLLGSNTHANFFAVATSCNLQPYGETGLAYDVSAYIDGTESISLALISAGGAHVTLFAPNDVYANQAALEADCGGFGIVVDAWYPNAFVPTAGVYEYDVDGIATAGITMKTGFTDPPYLLRVSGYAGVLLRNSSDNVFTNITSVTNTYAFWFDGSSASNSIIDSQISGSLADDFLSVTESGTNEIRNTGFTHASTTVAGSGTLSIYEKIVVTVRNALNELIGGAVVNYSSANTAQTGVATTTASGTAPTSTDLLASVYTATTTAITAGGYNPYTFSISATSTYGATTTAINLSEPYQAITIYLAAAEEPEPDPEPAPSSGNTNITQPQDPAPIITSFKINNGETVTPTTTVLISLAASNAMQMVISEDSSFTNAVSVAYQSSFSMSLSTSPGVKTLYARVYNAQGISSGTSAASIEYNPIAPPVAPTGSVSVTGSIVDSMTSSTQVTLLLVYDGRATEMMISNSSDYSNTSWQAVAATKSWTLTSGDGVKHVYVKYKSAQNLESPTYTASVVLDQTGPAKPLFIGAIENGVFTISPTTIAGTSEPNTRVSVRVTRNSTTTLQQTVVANGLGVWSVSVPSVLANGTYNLSAYAADSLGNIGQAQSTSFVIKPATIEEPVEPQPELTLPPESTPTIPAESGNNSAGEQGAGSVGADSGSSSGSSGSAGSGNVITPTTTPENPPLEPEQKNDGFSGEEQSRDSVVTPIKIEVNAVEEKTVEVAKAAVASVSKVAAKTTQVIKTVQAIPEVQVANQAVVVPAAAAISVAAVSGAVNGAQALTYLQFLFTQPAFLLARRRRKGWGVVYNAITKMPADLATVRLIDSATGRIVQSRVTDQMGRYQFFAKPGSYTIDISKPNYQFPVSYLQGKKEDGKYLDLYTGGAVNAVSAAALSFNAPLDPVGADKPLEQLVRAERKKMFAALFGSIGLAVTAVSFVISPTPIVGGFLVLHAVSHFMFRRIAIPKKPESWGVVSGPDGKPLEQAVIRVFDKQYNKLLDTQVTDDKGRYAFLVGKNEYYLMIEKPGFQKVVTDTIAVPEVEGGSVLAANVQLQK